MKMSFSYFHMPSFNWLLLSETCVPFTDFYFPFTRFKNYMVALMNKNLLPSKICLPIIGESVCFSRGLRYNIEMILFRGPWAPFENNWKLKEEFKRASNRNELAQKLSRQIFWMAFGNLLLSPLVFLWSLMVFFFSYADVKNFIDLSVCWTHLSLSPFSVDQKRTGNIRNEMLVAIRHVVHATFQRIGSWTACKAE